MTKQIKCPTCGGNEFTISLYEKVSRTLFVDTSNANISIEEDERLSTMTNFKISCNSNTGCVELSDADQDKILASIYNY